MNWKETGEVVKAVAPVAQIGLILLGWRFISRDNNRREARKELRSAINSLREQVYEIEEQAVKYYKSVGKDSEGQAIRIKNNLQRLSLLIQIHCVFDKANFDIDDNMVSFRQAVTGNDFDSKLRVPREDGDPLFDKVFASAMQLVHQLELLFTHTYRQDGR